MRALVVKPMMVLRLGRVVLRAEGLLTLLRMKEQWGLLVMGVRPLRPLVQASPLRIAIVLTLALRELPSRSWMQRELTKLVLLAMRTCTG